MSDAAAAPAAAPAGQAADAAAAAANAPAIADAAAAATGTNALGQTAADLAQPVGADGTIPGVDTTGWPDAAVEALRKQHTENYNLRQERGNERVAAKANAAKEARDSVLADIQKVLNPDAAAGAEATVESLTADAARVGTERDGALRSAETYRAALLALMPGDDAAKADALDFLAYKLSRDTAFNGIDPTDAEFGSKIVASVSPLVAADPRFKLSGTAAASGVESLGGASGTDTITQERFEGMSMAEKGQLYLNDRPTYDRLSGNSR